MICQKCGKQLNDDFNLCPYCGYKVRQDANMCIGQSPEDQQGGSYNFVNQQIPQNSQYNSVNQAPSTNVKKNNKAIGILSLIFGIIGLLLSCIFIGIVPALIAIILGIIGLCKRNGTVLSTFGLLFGIIGIVIFSMFLLFSEPTDNENSTNQHSQEENSINNHPEYSENEILKTEDQETQKEQYVETESEVNNVIMKISEEQLRDEFIDSCEEFNYKKIARNPDDYVGHNFKVNVQIFSVSEKTWLTDSYMKAYTDDGNGYYFDKMIYIFDEQNEKSEYYVNVLEDDIITVYGTFEEMVESKNMINGETSKEIALHMKYTELISDGE